MTLLIKAFGILFLSCVLCGCSYSMTNVLTEGRATDVGDDTNDPKVDVTASIPITPKL